MSAAAPIGTHQLGQAVVCGFRCTTVKPLELHSNLLRPGAYLPGRQEPSLAITGTEYLQAVIIWHGRSCRASLGQVEVEARDDSLCQ